MLRSARVQILVGVAVSLLLIVWLAWSIDWRVAWGEMRRLSVAGVVLLTVTLLVSQLFRAWRWQYFLPGKRVPILPLFAGVMIGNLATFLLPLRAGEFVRPYVLSRIAGVPFSVGFTSVVIERFFDLTCVLLLFALLLPSMPKIPDWALHGAFILGGLAAGIAIVIVWALVAQRKLERFIQSVARFLPAALARPVVQALNGFLAGCGVLRDPRRIFFVIVGTMISWASNILVCGAGMVALGIPTTVVFASSLAVILALAVAAPSAPGFIGVFQTACIAAFVVFDVSKEQGAAYAVVSHLHQYLVYIIVGVALLARFELRLLELWKGSQKGEAPAP